MTRSYEEVTAQRRQRLNADATQATRVFEQSYDIAMQIVELRQVRGMTQAELAAKCRVDQADISRIERGVTNPTSAVLQRVANALDADLKLIARTQ